MHVLAILQHPVKHIAKGWEQDPFHFLRQKLQIHSWQYLTYSMPYTT